MNKISGKVIVKESGVGIPDLLIVIYDLDPECNLDEILTSKKSLSGTEFWSQFKGDRIGSVLTSNLGMFELSYEDTEFQVQDVEKRPDLVLLVMAPEEPKSIKQRISTSPQQLLLYCSNIPRGNAGRSESYIVRLPIDELERLGIPYLVDEQGRVLDDKSRNEQISKRLLDGWARQDMMRDLYKTRLRTNQKRIDNLKDEIRKRISPSIFQKSRTKHPDGLHLNSEQDLDAVMKEARLQGVDRMAKLFAKNPSIIRFSKTQLAMLGLESSEDGKTKEISFSALVELVDKIHPGGMVRNRQEKVIIDIPTSPEEPI